MNINTAFTQTRPATHKWYVPGNDGDGETYRGTDSFVRHASQTLSTSNPELKASFCYTENEAKPIKDKLSRALGVLVASAAGAVGGAIFGLPILGLLQGVTSMFVPSLVPLSVETAAIVGGAIGFVLAAGSAIRSVTKAETTEVDKFIDGKVQLGTNGNMEFRPIRNSAEKIDLEEFRTADKAAKDTESSGLKYREELWNVATEDACYN